MLSLILVQLKFSIKVCVFSCSRLAQTWDSWVSWRTAVRRGFNTTCTLRTVHGTLTPCSDYARTCAHSGSRRGRMMTCGQASQSTCQSAQPCVAVDAAFCSWRSRSSTASSSTFSSTTRSTASVVLASSSVYRFTINLTPTHDLTSSATCAASTTIPTTFGPNWNLLSEVRWIPYPVQRRMTKRWEHFNVRQNMTLFHAINWTKQSLHTSRAYLFL